MTAFKAAFSRDRALGVTHLTGWHFDQQLATKVFLFFTSVVEVEIPRAVDRRWTARSQSPVQDMVVLTKDTLVKVAAADEIGTDQNNRAWNRDRKHKPPPDHHLSQPTEKLTEEEQEG